MTRIVAAAAVAVMGVAMLATPAQARTEGPRASAKVAQTAPWGERSLLNINNVSMWFKRDGYSGKNPLNDNSGVTFPRSTDQIIYQDGMIWGGIVNDGDPQSLRVGGQTYEIGTVPGAIVSKGVAEDPSDPSVRIYRIRRDFRTADLRLDASELLGKGLSEVTDADVAELRAQYEADWREWPVDKGAPFYDNDGDGVYSPAFDASGNPILDGTADEPGVANADQVAWFVINDLDVGAATSLYGSKPIGLEVGVTLWGYARTDALGDVIFKKYTIVYEGTANTPDDATISDMYFAQWADPDVGDYGDDFAGSDVNLSLGYAYNGQETDSHYDGFGLAPPAVGYDFLQGPAVPVYLHDADGNIVVDEETGEPVLDTNSEAFWNFGTKVGYKNLPMTSYVYFAAGSAIDDPELGEYVGTEEWYNLLRGFQPQPDINNPVPYTNAVTGEETKFTLDGDPTRAQGWNDGVPLPAGDRRIVLNTGPFEMALGDTQEVVVALLGAVGTTRLRSVAKLKFTDQFVQDAYNSAFQVPSPPTAPNVRSAQLDQSLVLDWGWDPTAIIATEQEGSAGFAFEGYNIYQLPSAEATLSQGVRVATYDVENGVTTILGIDLDDQSGIVLDVPQQIGTDFGVKRNITITQDYIRGGPLVNGQEYYFAVTAYNRATGDAAAVTTLESSPQLLIVKPQLAPPGTRYEAEPALTIDASHAAGASDGSVVASVVDPTQTTGDTYEVRFDTDADGNTIWNLVNVTDGVTLLTGATDQTGAANYIGADGFEIAVSGPPNGMKSWAAPAQSYEEWAAENGGGTVADYVEANDQSSATRWFTWAGGSGDWGGEGFQGAMTGDPNNQWFAPTTVTPDRLRTVDLRFTSVVETPGENQYRPLDVNNENVSMAYRYLRGAGAEPPTAADFTTEPAVSNPWDFGAHIVNTEGPGVYVYQDRVPIPMSAWDIESDPPRRLEIAFLENNVAGGLVNSLYGPPFYGDASNITAREWLFIFDLDYTDPAQGENSEILLTNGLIPTTVDADGNPTGESDLPFMWIIFSERRVVDRFPQDGDRFLLVANHVNTADDVFSFTVPGVDSSELLLKEDVKKVNVFPNPYYGVNEAETNRYNSFITFSHLPQRATIRIFDLSGTLVRVMEKDNADQFQRWDLANDNGLPVASGLYIAHVEMPDAGATKTLKLAVVAEEQFLENY